LTKSDPTQQSSEDLQDSVRRDYQSALGRLDPVIVRLPGITTQSGFTFKELDISYLTIGRLSPQKDNAILICHALSGNAQVAGMGENGRPGWWDFHVGPGKTIDTNRFFVICSKRDRRLQRLNRPREHQSGHRGALRHVFSTGDHPGHGGSADSPD
jgi:hypothetical protein